MRRLPLALLRGLVLALLLGLGAAHARADTYDPQRAGHPLRVAAYVLHPVGVLLDGLIFRPAHWFVHRSHRLEYLFGHTE